MKTETLSVTVPSASARGVEAAAREEGVSVSEWVAEAIDRHLTRKAGREFLARWEADHGPVGPSG